MMSGNFRPGRAAVLLALALFGFPCVRAQDVSWIYADGTPIATDGEAAETAGNEPLPRQFRGLSLGMLLDDLKSALMEDSYFNFRGDRDVSLLPARDQSLVETTGSGFIRRAFFQLRDGELFIMAFTLNTNRVDHYSIFTHLVKKYGQPTSLNPRETVWENDETRIALERPLTVKYIDKKIFNDIINESTVNESGQVRARQEFIDGF